MIYDFFKRALDILGAIVGIIIFSPVMLAIIVAIKIDSPGPILADTPLRVGKDGKLFRLYKFRSMVVGAFELLKNKYPDLYKRYKQNSYKLELNEDPRITNSGRFIRKTSLDELPQFFNV